MSRIIQTLIDVKYDMHVLDKKMQKGMKTGGLPQATRAFVSSLVVFYLAMFCAAFHSSSPESLVMLLVWQILGILIMACY